ncbi:MAG: MGH1-like glycoside hydrolase domain-containing protein [Chloroflexota bacterium]
MRIWNLKVSPPLSFTLAADSRFGPTDYTDDHIWELGLGGGEPPALSFQTTFGLRALSFRIFPRFTEHTTSVSDPADFASPLTLRAMAPNYVCLVFSPLPELLVTSEYWVASSQAVAGRFQLENRGPEIRRVCLDLAANLSPAPEGERMKPTEISAVSALVGRTGGLYPVVFLSGGPHAAMGVYPSLALELELSARQTQTVTWSQAALHTPDESFSLARQTAARNWEAELARIELINGGTLEVYTGDKQWDFALALSQKIAFGLMMSAVDQFFSPSFVITRHPDQGYSPRGDGSDYPPVWSGQTPLDVFVLLDQVLPSAPQFALGLLRNFLSTQGEDGFVDWKPGLGGQRSQVWATPLLASLAEKVYRATGDRVFLEDAFPKLLAFLQGWMSRHDRDGDGIPEWDHPIQTGFEDHPLFSRWQDGSQGAEITAVEGPDLCAFLYRECQALGRVAALLGRSEAVTALQGFMDNLQAAVEAAWDARGAGYHYWDRDSHQRSHAVMLGDLTGPGEIFIERSFDPPVRLLAHVSCEGEQGRQISIFVNGQGVSGQSRVERIDGDAFRWRLSHGLVTGERVYASLNRIEVQNIGPNDRVSFRTVGLEGIDQTLLLPLWAGIPSGERATQLIENTLLNPERFWRPFGIRACVPHTLSADAAGSFLTAVHIPWNILIGSGLLAYGRRDEAANLVGRLMRAVTACLQREGVFRRFYDADTGAGSGERNALQGLAPLGLFLDVLGVYVRSPWEVALAGSNPFPWPVTVKYRGLTVLRRVEKTTVIFPDGQTIEVTDPTPCVVVNH